ncbi:VOC family protein [Mucilaginibacter sp.]|uniref:VOC family protein n=1 Tax=Mucilaginibacter sp. TaxID=1882438 RepID=UPI0025DF1B16|nr:VOC family protein [Mucilaginibacter sp.]
MATSPNIRLAVPFFIVRDMEASLSFYRDKLGFAMTHQWTPRDKIEWCSLQRDNVSLMLQQPATDDHWVYHLQEAGKGISICFQCADALALFHEFKGNGIEINEPFVGNNMWVVAFSDPDGYRLDFESQTDVPEETKYSEWFKRKA